MTPAGLDGNPEPVRTPQRRRVIDVVADQIERLPDGRRLVAVDGIDGAGKSTFADEIASVVASRGTRPVLRSTIDSFHRPRAERHRRGPGSASGFYLDSHQLDTLRSVLLEPFAAGARVVPAVFDEPTDTAVDPVVVDAPTDAVLVFDGLFLQRPELVEAWDLTIYVDGRRRVSDRRIQRATRDRPVDDPAAGFVHDLQWCVRLHRYVDGQRLYHEGCDPVGHADIVVVNDDLERPAIVGRIVTDRTDGDGPVRW